MLALAAAGLRSVQRTRLISTSCFSRRSSPLSPRTHRSIRSLMRIRSVGLFMQVAPSVDVNHISRDEIGLDQKGYGVCDVLRPAMLLEWNGMNKVFDVTLVLAGRWQNQPWGDGVDGNVR